MRCRIFICFGWPVLFSCLVVGSHSCFRFFCHSFIYSFLNEVTVKGTAVNLPGQLWGNCKDDHKTRKGGCVADSLASHGQTGRLGSIISLGSLVAKARRSATLLSPRQPDRLGLIISLGHSLGGGQLYLHLGNHASWARSSALVGWRPSQGGGQL